MHSPTHPEADTARDTQGTVDTVNTPHSEPEALDEPDPHLYTPPLDPSAQILGIFVGAALLGRP